MTDTPRVVTAALIAPALVLAIAALSRAPYAANPRDDALLRLSWRARSERIETCRTLSDSALAALPAHMRQRVVCTGGAASYRLRVVLDGASQIDEIVRAGDVRRSRPLFVFGETLVAPGSHHVVIDFARADGARPPETAAADTVGARRQAEELPPRLTLDTAVTLAPRQVLLVTYDPERRQLLIPAPPAE
jgi:hypothetical protein